MEQIVLVPHEQDKLPLPSTKSSVMPKPTLEFLTALILFTRRCEGFEDDESCSTSQIVTFIHQEVSLGLP